MLHRLRRTPNNEFELAYFDNNNVTKSNDPKTKLHAKIRLSKYLKNRTSAGPAVTCFYLVIFFSLQIIENKV